MIIRAALLVTLVGCGGCSKTDAAGSRSCATIVAEQQKIVHRLPSACKVDGDCVCYNGGTPATHCGDYAARAVAARLDALTERYRKARCDPSIACAPRRCSPGCIAGKCGEKPFSR